MQTRSKSGFQNPDFNLLYFSIIAPLPSDRTTVGWFGLKKMQMGPQTNKKLGWWLRDFIKPMGLVLMKHFLLLLILLPSGSSSSMPLLIIGSYFTWM